VSSAVAWTGPDITTDPARQSAEPLLPPEEPFPTR